MKTVGQLRYEKQLAIPVNVDSLYKPIERPNRVFNRLNVPKALQAALPFKSKPKTEAPRKRRGGGGGGRHACVSRRRSIPLRGWWMHHPFVEKQSNAA